MINNYKSSEYANYNKILNKLPKIFGKKTFKIEYRENQLKCISLKKMVILNYYITL